MQSWNRDRGVFEHSLNGLDQTAHSEVFLDDNVIHGAHDKSYLGGVSCACKVCVDLFGLGLVQGYKSIEDIVASGSIVRATFVVGEVVLHRAYGELLLESVDLVQEKDDAGLDEPSRIADTVEKCKSFLHTVHSFVFEQKLVVFRNGNQEQDGGNILEAVDPLLSF